ncbi:MAG: DUF547 domain-containing protein [Gammaproteobacteria bacterium]|jgi:hypothetical protein
MRKRSSSASIAQYARVVLLFMAVNYTVSAAPFDHTHSLWDELLQTYVVDHGAYSEVQYQPLKQTGTHKLSGYLQSLSSVSKNQFDQWTQAQRLAFLINAYNAFTVKLIIDHYPVDSIKDIGGFFRSPWKITFFTLLGEETHLDYIEHELIRGRDYAEPRIHFALVCASVGCPKLQAHAYTADRLGTMLDAAAKTFLGDTSRNRYDSGGNILYLSPLFKWYGEDFAAKAGSVEKFVAPYITDDPLARQRIRSKHMDVEYLNYDWSLNDANSS